MVANTEFERKSEKQRKVSWFNPKSTFLLPLSMIYIVQNVCKHHLVGCDAVQHNRILATCHMKSHRKQNICISKHLNFLHTQFYTRILV